MTTQTSQFIKDIDARYADLHKDTPGWLKTLREQAYSLVQQTGFPTTKDEEWKYTNVQPLVKQTYEFDDLDILPETDAARLEALFKDDAIRIVFVNGHLNQDLSRFHNLPDGLSIRPITEAVANNGMLIKDLIGKFDASTLTPFTSLNYAMASEGVAIKVDKKAIIKEPVHIIHVTSPSVTRAAQFPRTVIYCSPSSESTICETHISFQEEASYFSNALTDIHIEENAVCRYTKIQKEGNAASHIGMTRVWIERNAKLDGFTFTCGGKLTRNDLNIVLNGEGCDAHLNGLYSLTGKQHADNHTSVDHRFPNCTSNQLYKGLLNHSSRAVFNGKIFVRSIAQKTNSYQLNKNLLIGKDCRIDTKPQLEIFADDVRCTHGATIGQLNEDEIFYLQSRSIPRSAAIKMLAEGFLDDSLSQIDNETIRQKARTLLQPTIDAIE